MNQELRTQIAPHATLAKRLFRLLASFGLAIVLLAFLFLLTLLGTLEQAEFGIYAVQQKYFNSLFLIHDCFGVVPLPLPGVYLLLVLLFVNLLCGGIIRARKHWRSPGNLIAHGGILFLLVGGFVAFHGSVYGMLQLYEGEVSDEFQEYHEWVVEIRRLEPTPSETVWIIPGKDLTAIGTRGTRTFVAPALPFDLTLSGYLEHGQPVPNSVATAARVVDGLSLRPMVRDPEADSTIPGAYLDVSEHGGATVHTTILWGMARQPYTVTIGGERWMIDLTRRTRQLPFQVRLDDFTVELHPNTRIAKVYRSDITKIEGGVEQPVRISMNEPLRYHGYTLFQATWGPENAPPGTPLYSGFAVVHNPADHWPLYACIIVGVGLLIHFLQKFIGHLRKRAA